MKKLLLLCSAAIIIAPTAAFAQSTGTVDFDKDAIVVTGTRVQQVGGVQAPDSSKAKAVLTQEIISRSSPGQSILDTINLVPGVSFQNNDAYGSSGGTLNIRGFDASRISLTFDGIPLNDSGNYAIFSNQQLDPELIEQVNVNLGTTDVDSPTASAVGGTVNYRTRNPYKKFGGRFALSGGEFNFFRYFASLDTGEFGPFGTRAFITASHAENDLPFNNYGKVNKKQFNAKVYQPIGNNGDFVSVAGNYNENRNNFFGSVPLRVDTTQSPVTPLNVAPRVVGSGTTNRFPTTAGERFYNINYPCTTATPVTETVPQISAAGYRDPDAPNTCGTEFDRRYNPSNTGNIRINSRFTLAPGVVLTVDPSYQYVKANGGGTVTAREFGFDTNPTGTTSRSNCATTLVNSATVNCVPGYFGGSPYFGGVDLNGDGDRLDTVTLIAPSQTRTRRYGLIAGLRWEINPNNTVRVTYSHDRANHRQTGEVIGLRTSGEPLDVFPVNNPLVDANGNALQKRDRQSYAILDQVSGEYRGDFGPLTATVGLRAPYFKRDLQNNCFTSSASGFVECTGNPALNAQLGAFNPTYSPPGRRVLKYHKLLPNIGLTYDFTRNVSAFANYAKGLSVPSTDSLYNAFFFPENTPQARPAPETTDSFDGGLRYRSSKIQAQLSGWYTKFNNRLASAYDPELNQTVYRNLGSVTKYGVDGSVSYSPIPQFTAYVFGSYLKSKIKDNIQTGVLPAGVTCDSVDPTTTTGLRNCAFTAGRRESGSPVYTYGVSAVGRIGPVDLGVTAKRTGKRYVFDDNRAVFAGDIGTANSTSIYGAAAPAYWLVNLDARINGKLIGAPKTFIQFNAYNVFNKLYVGGFGGGLNQATSTRTVAAVPATPTTPAIPAQTLQTYGAPPFVQIGAPRTLSASINFEF